MVHLHPGISLELSAAAMNTARSILCKAPLNTLSPRHQFRKVYHIIFNLSRGIRKNNQIFSDSYSAVSEDSDRAEMHFVARGGHENPEFLSVFTVEAADLLVSDAGLAKRSADLLAVFIIGGESEGFDSLTK